RRERNARHDSSRFNVGANQHIQIALRWWLARNEVELGILTHLFLRHEFSGIALGHRRGDLRQVTTLTTISLHFNLGVARDIDGVVLLEMELLAGSGHLGSALQTDQTNLMILAVEFEGRVLPFKRDPSVMQIPGGRSAGSHCCAASFALM